MLQHIPRLFSVTLFVLLFGFTTSLVGAQTDDTAAIRKLVEQFFSAYAKEDIEGLMSMWSQDSTELTASKQSFQKAFGDLNNIEVKNLDIRKVTIEADKATVRLQMEVSALDAKTGKPADSLRKENRTFRLVKQRADWKVSQYVVTENELAVALLAAKTTAERRRKRPQRRDTASLAALKTKQEKARLDYEAFQTNLYAAHPELKVPRGQSRLLSIDELDQLLNDNKTAILEYVVGEKNSHLFVITKAAGRGTGSYTSLPMPYSTIATRCTHASFCRVPKINVRMVC